MTAERLSNEDWDRRVLDPEVSREAVERGMDWYLASMESLSIAIRQRQMTPEQVERYARLLSESETDLLRRPR